MKGVWLAITAVVAAASAARADECEALVGPAELGVREVDAGAPRLPCVERRLSVRLRGAAAIDLPNFYGTIGAAALAGVRWPVGGVELSADARVVGYTYAQDASFVADDAGVGPLALGVLVPIPLDRAALAAVVRAVLPYTDTTLGVAAGTLEASLQLAVPLPRALTLQASAGLLGWGAAPAGTVTGRAAAFAAGGAGWRAGRVFSATLGLETQIGWYGWGLDHVLARGALRFATRRAGRFELAAAAPFAGAERTTAVMAVGWSSDL